MTVVSGDIIRVTAKMTISGGDFQNVYHARTGGGPVSDADVLTGMLNAMNASYNWIDDALPTALFFTTVAVWNVTQDAPLGEDDWPTLVNGLATGDIAPYQTSYLVRFGTLAPRSQGRKYLPPFAESFLTSAGEVSAAAVGHAANYANALVGDVDLGTWQYVFGNWSPSIPRFAPWVSSTADNVLRTQRRRVLGYGS